MSEKKEFIFLIPSAFLCVNYICFFIHTHMDTLSIYFFSSLLCSIFNSIIIHLNHWHRWSTNFHISIAPQMPSCNKLLIHYKTHHNPRYCIDCLSWRLYKNWNVTRKFSMNADLFSFHVLNSLFFVSFSVRFQRKRTLIQNNINFIQLNTADEVCYCFVGIWNV